ncbi:hypothetical protein FOZ62_031160 [Perkinsus olseni]|uniref:Uncharacterized protein n=1 Tax=Perkinsus olseni TaxID=32597 RepID=A0A7J6TC34_PEROL|nr:hypothetical protein FOZ62_031160 [Perkinsus olseni]
MRAFFVVAVGVMAPGVYGSGTWKKVRSLFKSKKSGKADLATVNDIPGVSEAEGAVARRVNKGRSSVTLGVNSGPMSYAFGVNRGATLGDSSSRPYGTLPARRGATLGPGRGATLGPGRGATLGPGRGDTLGPGRGATLGPGKGDRLGASGSRLSYNPGVSRGDTLGASSSRMYGTLPARRGDTLGPGRGASLGPGRGASLGPGRGASLGTGWVPMPDNLGASRGDTLGVTRIQVDHTPGSSKEQVADASKVSRALDVVEVLQTKGAPVRAEPIAVPAAQVTGTASLVYTTPLGSRDKKRDFGGIVVYGKEVTRGGSVEHIVDYLYFWDSQQYHRNRSRLNVLFDLPGIIPHNWPRDSSTTLRTWLEYLGSEGYHRIHAFKDEFGAQYLEKEHLTPGKPRGLVNHIMAMEKEFRRSVYWEFETNKLAICLWGYVFDLVYKQQRRRELFLCPSVAADVGDVKVTITLSAKGFDELRVHEIEVMGSRIWQQEDVQTRHVNFIRELQEKTRRVGQRRSIDACEEQLLEYAKTIAGRTGADVKDTRLSRELGERQSQLRAAVGIVYTAWMKGGA